LLFLFYHPCQDVLAETRSKARVGTCRTFFSEKVTYVTWTNWLVLRIIPECRPAAFLWGTSMIEIKGSYRLAAPRERVWPVIFDPNALMGLIPGCNHLEQTSPDEYRGQVKVGIASVSGTYNMFVKVVRSEPPEFCQFEGEISGPTGLIKGTAFFTLNEVEEKSVIGFQAQSLVTGALGKLSYRFIEGVVQTFIKVGLANLDKQLQQEVPRYE
jgi:carbon monoxide dehydrogenase subunit G